MDSNFRSGRRYTMDGARTAYIVKQVICYALAKYPDLTVHHENRRRYQAWIEELGKDDTTANTTSQ